MTTTQATAVVDCRNLGVRYGRVQALEQASFTVEPGQVYALLGRNGSGTERLQRFRVPLELPFGKLSRGQKAKLSLTLALGPGPELLILDDPTLGLDAGARHEVYDELLCELAERGTTILIATHDLAGIEGIADRVGLLHGGRLLVDASLEDLKARYHKVSWAPFRLLQPDDLAPYGPLRIHEGSLGGEAVLSQGDPRELLGAGEPDLQVQALSLEELFVALLGVESEVAS